MLKARNKENDKIYLAAEAYKKLPDPEDYEWVCPNCGENVYPKEEHSRLREDTDKVIWVTSHFSHGPDSSCKKTGESQQHYSKKLLILSQLYSDRLSLKVGGAILFIPSENIKGAEVTRGSNRADILVEFEEENEIFGSGIVFEIVESEEMDSVWNKFKSWFKKGYSFTYYDKSDFDGNKPKSGVLEVKYPFITGIEKYSKDIYDDIKSRIERLEGIDYTTKLYEKYEKEYTCSNCYHSGPDKDRNGNFTGLVCCWKGYKEGENERPDGKFKPTHTCNDYRYKRNKNLLKIIEKNINGGEKNA